MTKTSVYKLIQALNAWELRAFLDFVQSPFFNKRSDVTALFQYLLKYKDRPKHLQREKVWTFIYPDKPFNAQNMRLLSSYLFQLLEQFLAIREIKTDKQLMAVQLTNAYKKRRIDDFFLKSFRRTTKQLNDTSEHDFRSLHYKFELEQMYAAYIGVLERGQSGDLERLSTNFEIYFIAKRLQLSCIQFVHQKNYLSDYDSGMPQLVLKYIEQRPQCLEHPIVAAYFACYNLLKGEDDAYFLQFIQDIKRNKYELEAEDLGEILNISINYCVFQLNEGKESYINFLFDLYQMGIEQKLLLEDDLLSPFIYRNIVSIGLASGNLTWTEQFIKSHQAYLPFQYRDSMYRSSLAQLNYQNGDIVAARDLLQNFHSQDSGINISVKMLLVRIYYELNEYELLDALLTTIYSYVGQRKELVKPKKKYQKAVRLTQKLMSIRPYDKAKKQKLQNEIEIAQIPSSFKQWLLRQLKT